MDDSTLNRLLGYLDAARDEVPCERGPPACLDENGLTTTATAEGPVCHPCQIRAVINYAERHARRKT